MKKELICFDLDATLLRSDIAHVESFNGAFEAFGCKRINKKLLARALNGQTGLSVVQQFYPGTPRSTAMKMCREHERLMVSKFARFAKPITANTLSSLRALKKNFDLALVSNSSVPEIKALLRGAKIPSSLFTTIVGRDMVKRGKPAPDMILAVERLSRKKVALFVGDSIFDLQAGRKAKVRTVAVLTGKYSRKELEKEKPLFIVRNIDFLLTKLEKQNVFKSK